MRENDYDAQDTINWLIEEGNRDSRSPSSATTALGRVQKPREADEMARLRAELVAARDEIAEMRQLLSQSEASRLRLKSQIRAANHGFTRCVLPPLRCALRCGVLLRLDFSAGKLQPWTHAFFRWGKTWPWSGPEPINWSCSWLR